MIAYHGGPITPETCAVRAWTRGHAFVSFDHSTGTARQIETAAAVSNSFSIDNGAFPIWKRTGEAPDTWDKFYRFAGEWLAHPACDWAVIPDVIGGTEAENDALVFEWPHGHRGVPVWHLNESIDRLVRLAEDWPRIALGSAAQFDVKRPSKCIARLAEALRPISDANGTPLVKLHGLRMLNPAMTSVVPLSSADSTNVARNIGMDGAWSRSAYAPTTKEARVDVLRDRIENVMTPATMQPIPLEMTLDLFGEAS